MHLKLNSDKTEYILFRSKAQLKKISPEQVNVHGGLIEISKVVRYPGGFSGPTTQFQTAHYRKEAKVMNNLIKSIPYKNI